MRSTLAALALAVAVAIGLAVPVATPVRAADAAAGGVGPKVVIIVGATHGTTERYRDYADAAYAEAIKYTPNVVKVYSPNATWTKVKAAAVGASIVIYFGHGNGWPSPYTYDPDYTTKDGFGLNATAGNGDSNTKYYGEPSVATLDLAPNAIVLLHHLCYASGNSEPGHAAPSVTHRPQAGRQLRRRLPAHERPGGPRRRPSRSRRVPAGDLHHEPDHRAAVAVGLERQRQRHLVRLDPDARRDGLHRSGQPTSGLLPLARRRPRR